MTCQTSSSIPPTEEVRKTSSVQILKGVISPSDPSVAVLTVVVDLGRPGHLAEDFRRALREHPAIALNPHAARLMPTGKAKPSVQQSGIETDLAQPANAIAGRFKTDAGFPRQAERTVLSKRAKQAAKKLPKIAPPDNFNPFR